MKYYLDITLLPDAEANLGFLWQKVYQQVHLGLVENKVAENESVIAVSFPNYGDKVFPLGDKLRLFADNQRQLEQLDIAKWLSRLTDYTHMKSIIEVPGSINQFALFKRKQIKSNIEKKAKKRAKHLNKSYSEVLEYLLKEQTDLTHDKYRSNLPFIQMESLSSKNRDRFPLFIERQFLDSCIEGKFTTYGLSKTATVPWF